jgi:hypothetical protein
MPPLVHQAVGNYSPQDTLTMKEDTEDLQPVRNPSTPASGTLVPVTTIPKRSSLTYLFRSAQHTISSAVLNAKQAHRQGEVKGQSMKETTATSRAEQQRNIKHTQRLSNKLAHLSISANHNTIQGTQVNSDTAVDIRSTSPMHCTNQSLVNTQQVPSRVSNKSASLSN